MEQLPLPLKFKPRAEIDWDWTPFNRYHRLVMEQCRIHDGNYQYHVYLSQQQLEPCSGWRRLFGGILGRY